MSIAPIIWTWTDEGVMLPSQRFRAVCDQEFVIGEHYRMQVIEERSLASHSHYFANLNEAWQNLPEMEADRFPTSEHLRKWCLIKAGYCDQRSIPCASKAEAQRFAAFVKPMDAYAIVTAVESVVTVYTAQSQSMRAMGKAKFQDSKTRVLEIAWGMVGVSPELGAQNAGRAA